MFAWLNCSSTLLKQAGLCWYARTRLVSCVGMRFFCLFSFASCVGMRFFCLFVFSISHCLCLYFDWLWKWIVKKSGLIKLKKLTRIVLLLLLHHQLPHHQLTPAPHSSTAASLITSTVVSSNPFPSLPHPSPSPPTPSYKMTNRCQPNVNMQVRLRRFCQYLLIQNTTPWIHTLLFFFSVGMEAGVGGRVGV